MRHLSHEGPTYFAGGRNEKRVIFVYNLKKVKVIKTNSRTLSQLKNLLLNKDFLVLQKHNV